MTDPHQISDRTKEYNSCQTLLGNPLSRQSELLIAGGGFAGLALGFFLKQAGIPFRIAERKKTVGGLLGSVHSEFGTAEQAANGFLWCSAMQEMADTLGVEVLPPDPAAKKRYLVRDGQLHRNPLRTSELLKIIPRLLTSGENQFQTVGDFSDAVLGEAATKYLVSPGLAGIYGADPFELSFKAVAPGLQHALQKHRLPLSAFYSFARRKKQERKQEAAGREVLMGTHSFAGGMQTLISALSDYLQDDIDTERDITEESPFGREIVCTLPAHVAASWLSDKHSVLAGMLAEVKYLSMHSCTGFFKLDELKNFKPGFGCLIPKSENFNYLGVLFNHCIFPDRATEGYGSFTGILRDHHGSIPEKTDQEMGEMLRQDLARLFGSAGAPAKVHVFNWQKGIPLYSAELLDAWGEIDRYLRKDMPSFRLFGNYTGEISLRGMASAAKALTQIIST